MQSQPLKKPPRYNLFFSHLHIKEARFASILLFYGGVQVEEDKDISEK